MHRPVSNRFSAFFLILILFLTPGCTTEPVETALLLPVDFSNVPDNMVLTDFHTDKVEIKIQADPRLIEMINTESIRYPVDLYADLAFDPAGDADLIEPGDYLIPVEEKRIPVDPAIRILNVNPPYLNVRIEKKLKKTFNITVPYTGEPAKGYIALEAATDPASVELIGAVSHILAIRELRTKPIDISNAKEGFKKKIPLDLNTPSVITATPIITVNVPVQQQLMSRSIDAIPIRAKNTPFAVMVEPPEISIWLKGPFEVIGSQDTLDEIFAFIDLAGLEPGVYVRHATINIPVGLMMTNAAPQVFTIKIE